MLTLTPMPQPSTRETLYEGKTENEVKELLKALFDKKYSNNIFNSVMYLYCNKGHSILEACNHLKH